jgi:dihydrofolate reductase
MRKIRYAVAMSLDGFIAGPNGEADWITMDPEIDFAAVYRNHDTALIGRKTFDGMVKAGSTTIPGMKIFVFSRSLRQADFPNVTIVGDACQRVVSGLKSSPGKDIWLLGGGVLFRSLLEASLVDAILVSVMPVLLGSGIPLLPASPRGAKLNLTDHKFYKSGIVSLQYSVTYSS